MKKSVRSPFRPGPYFLSAVMFTLVLGLGAFVVNEVAFFNEGFPLTRMTDVEFYAAFALYLLAFAAYLVFGKYRFRYQEPWWLDALLFAFLCFGAVGIFAYPSETLLPNGYLFVVDLPNKPAVLFLLAHERLDPLRLPRHRPADDEGQQILLVRGDGHPRHRPFRRRL